MYPSTDVLFSRTEFLWRLVRRSVQAFLDGKDRDMELANVGRALHHPETIGEISIIKEVWADARALKAKRDAAAAAGEGA